MGPQNTYDMAEKPTENNEAFKSEVLTETVQASGQPVTVNIFMPSPPQSVSPETSVPREEMPKEPVTKSRKLFNWFATLAYYCFVGAVTLIVVDCGWKKFEQRVVDSYNELITQAVNQLSSSVLKNRIEPHKINISKLGKVCKRPFEFLEQEVCVELKSITPVLKTGDYYHGVWDAEYGPAASSKPIDPYHNSWGKNIGKIRKGVSIVAAPMPGSKKFLFRVYKQ